MIGIYQDSFIDYLRDYLGDPIKVTSKNIVCKCPWCEYEETKTHYHLYISTEAPIFHCFYCHQKGSLSKFFKRIGGRDHSNSYVDKERVKKSSIKLNERTKNEQNRKFILPIIDEQSFKVKKFYLNKRFKFSDISLKNIPGLIFDFEEFVKINKIRLNEKQTKILPFLQSNFIGFLTKNHSIVICRNIDTSTKFRHYKLILQQTRFLDYYMLPGSNFKSNSIVLGEGIFDIYAEHIFDYTKLKSSCLLYAAGLSTSYHSLIKSIIFDTQIFKPSIYILSDSNITLPYYKKIKRLNSHIVSDFNIYYNKNGKDFNVTPVNPVINVL